MRNIVQMGFTKVRRMARDAESDIDDSGITPAKIARQLGRAIVGWLTVIVVIELVVKSLGAT